jgi:GT2 family glycosyltransferase
MGISEEAFLKTGGFAKIHPGEDPDLSQRIKKEGYDTAFIPNAFVYHKRRISWRKFFLQVYKFGLVRPILISWHPNSNRITFWFPTFFLIMVLASLAGAVLIHWMVILPLMLYLFIILVDSTFQNKSLKIGLMSVVAVFIQFFGYGAGFLKSTVLIGWLKKQPEKQFPQLFFK